MLLNFFFFDSYILIIIFLIVKLNSNRSVQGVFRGYDAFMNIVLHNVHEIVSKDEIVSYKSMVVRGNSVSSFSDPIELNINE